MRVVVLSSARWRSAWLSKQHVSAALASLGHEVLFVDPPVSALSLVRHPDRVRDLLDAGDEHPRPRLTVAHPRVVPGQSTRIGQRVNARLLRRRILSHMPDPEACIAFGLEARTVLGQLPGRRVYYCTDSLEDHPAFDAARVRRWEAAITAEADVVIACSRPLAEQLGARGVPARYVPHGCEVDRFAAARAAPVPQELRSASRPLIGYAGGMNFRIDADLLAAARRGAKGGTLVLIGGAWSSARGGLDPRAAAIAASPDVLTVDHRDGDELAALMAALDVGIVPYAMTPFNRKSFPLKIPQFLAAGVPVVSTPNGATDEHRVVRVATEPTSFETAVAAAAAAGPTDIDGPTRRWEDVAREIIDAIE